MSSGATMQLGLVWCLYVVVDLSEVTYDGVGQEVDTILKMVKDVPQRRLIIFTTSPSVIQWLRTFDLRTPSYIIEFQRLHASLYIFCPNPGLPLWKHVAVFRNGTLSISRFECTTISCLDPGSLEF